jgi:hypothetical protein
MLKILQLAIVATLLVAPITVYAHSDFEGIEGIRAGMDRGAAEGNAALGPVGAVVGGLVGGVVGMLGINPGPAYDRQPVVEHRSVYHHDRHNR